MFKHGYSKTRIHNIWILMHQRCSNPKATSYNYYGGRGVTVCLRWHNFMLFLADVGEPPTPKHTLDRIDNNGDYEPNNVRWITRSKQMQNTSVNKLTEQDTIDICEAYLKGNTTHRDLAKRYNVSHTLIRYIIKGRTWK